MKIIVHSMVGDGAIRGSLGVDDYSYYFVRRFFAEALSRFAEVVPVSDPAIEVDPIYHQAMADGETCLFLSFAPPQKTVLGLRCPVVPVFAWEFSTIPNEVWNDDIRNDWRAVFAVSHAAIALSSYTAGIVKAAMGETFPIAAIPAPVFERFRQEGGRAVSETAELRIAGTVLDTRLVEAFRSAPVWPRDPAVPLLTPGPLPPLILPASLPTVPAEPEPVVDVLVLPAAIESDEPLEPDAVVEPEVEAEPIQVAMDAVAVRIPLAIVAVEATNTDPIRIGWRRRLQITRHLALEWYRLAVRDLLPGPVRSANALAGRTMHRCYRVLRPLHAVPTPAAELPLEVFQAPSPDESVLVEVPTVELEPVVEPQPEPMAEPDMPVAEESLPACLVEPVPVALPEPVIPVLQVALDGVVFVSMFSPRDGRKNWNDIVTAFCWAMRDVSDATLVLKIVAADHEYEQGLRRLLGELSPMRCRVVVLHGFLEEPDYRELISAASFYVNASHCEGLCLPMLEFMSAGTPAIAPSHTAFQDYVAPSNAFVIGAGIENTVWPGDGRDLFRTTRFRIDWHALMLGYREAYRVARQEPERYAAMSRDARDTMARFCGLEPVTEALRSFLGADAETGLERAA